jgi:hypothetical protein
MKHYFYSTLQNGQISKLIRIANVPESKLVAFAKITTPKGSGKSASGTFCSSFDRLARSVFSRSCRITRMGMIVPMIAKIEKPRMQEVLSAFRRPFCTGSFSLFCMWVALYTVPARK